LKKRDEFNDASIEQETIRNDKMRTVFSLVRNNRLVNTNFIAWNDSYTINHVEDNEMGSDSENGDSENENSEDND
jgi:hypothetical protein